MHARGLCFIALTLLACSEPADETAAPGGGGGGGGGTVGCGPGALAQADGSCLDAGDQLSGCAAGELFDEAAGCMPAGIPASACAAGFDARDGGCEPVLPASPCAAGELALPGETSCRPVASCGAGQWGDIPIEQGAVFVDASAAPGGDGSQNAPYDDLQTAIDQAADGAMLALAAGTYSGGFGISGKSLRLWGVCPQQVSLVSPTTQQTPALTINTGSGTEVHRVAVTGGFGMLVYDSVDVVFEEVWIHDTTELCSGAQRNSTDTAFTLRGSLLESCSSLGVLALASDLTVEDSVIRDGQPKGVQGGMGIQLQDAQSGNASGQLVMARSIVERNRLAGVVLGSSSGEVDASVIRDNTYDAASLTSGGGFSVTMTPWSTTRGALTVRRSVISNNQDFGIGTEGSDLLVEHTVVRDTQPDESDAGGGRGIFAQDQDGERGNASVRLSLVEGNHEIGVFTGGSDTVLEGVLIRDTLPSTSHEGRGVAGEAGAAALPTTLRLDGCVLSNNVGGGVITFGVDVNISGSVIADTAAAADGRHGRGASMQHQANPPRLGTAAIEYSRIERNHEMGLAAWGADVTVLSTLISGTTSPPGGLPFGDGVGIFQFDGIGSAAIVGSVVRDNARAGVASFGAQITLESALLACNAIELNGEADGGVDFSFHDAGNNACGCDEADDCNVLSTGLAPPAPL